MSNPPSSGQPTRCSWNTNFDSEPFLSGEENYPVIGVDWCDAYAFCAWSGKRLCGRIGGGPTPTNDYANSAVSMWYSACVSGAIDNTFPYGDSYSPTSCNGGDSSNDELVAVKSMSACHSPTAPYSAIYDMSANADEWEDNCIVASGNGMNDHCRTRGGSYIDAMQWVRCDSDWLQQPEAFQRGERLYTVGFRCCAP
jgi:formylglycine-generating enzyme required for sulfatase activity